MEPEIYDAIYDLKKSIDKQAELQEEANNIMRGLIATLQETGQAAADLKEEMRQAREEDDD